MTTRRDVLQSSLAAGELSPDLAAREDVEAYFQGAAELLNVLPQTTAGATKRPGFIDLGPSDSDSVKSVLKPFAFSRTDVAYLEFTNLKLNIRDWTDATIVQSLVAPWAESDLDGLRVFQSADVVYITHIDHAFQPRALSRFAADNWSLDPWTIEDGPWLAANDTSITLQATSTGEGDAVTITTGFVDGYTPEAGEANPPEVFASGHVGAVFELGAAQAYFSGDQWRQDQEISSGTRVVSDGNVYEATSGGTTGANQPLHNEGAVNDGGVDWLFLHDGAGSVRITQVDSATQAQGVIERAIPSTDKTKYWREGAFSDFRGWPGVGVIYEERVGLFSTFFEPDTAFLSRVADYTPQTVNFRPSTGFNVITDADGVKRTLADAQVNPILWAVSHSRLYIGTANAIKRISGPTIDEAITPNPGGIVARDVTTEGASVAEPAVIQDAIIYPSADERRVLEYVMQETDRDPRDLTIRADQVGASAIKQMVTVKRPDKRVYIRREDGSLYVLTYDRRENFVAFSKILLGEGFVENLMMAPGMDGRDDLLAVVKRGDRRRLYRLARPWSPVDSLHDAQIYLDGAQEISLWHDGAVAITFPQGDAGDSVIISGPTGWLLSATVGDEIWVRAEGASALVRQSLTVYRATIDAIDGDSATATLEASVSAAIVSTDWCLPQTVFALTARENERVRVLADGYDSGEYAADAGGIITLTDPAGKIVYGDFYESRITSMPLATGTNLGSSRGEAMIIEEAFVKTRDTAGGVARTINGAGDRTGNVEIADQGYDENLRTGTPPATGNSDVNIRSPHDTELSIQIESNGPTAMTILGFKVGVTVNED